MPAPTVAEVVVVIPARDEEERLGAALSAVRLAVENVERSTDVRCRVVVVADDCSDASADIGRAAGADVLEVAFANVGAARSHGVHVALATSVHAPQAVWIANTDADSRVAPEWLVDQLSAAAAGWELVVGAVRPEPLDLTPVQLAAWSLRADAGRADGRMSTLVHGANLGIRADVYLRSGGFAALAVGEDADLVARTAADGARQWRSRRATVTTSARTVGRAPDGYAAYVLAHY